jgi:casein kinase 1, alpha
MEAITPFLHYGCSQVKKLSDGNQSSVYSALRADSVPVVIKCFSKNHELDYVRELEVLTKIKEKNLYKNGFPLIYSHKEGKKSNEIQMEALGQNIDQKTIRNPELCTLKWSYNVCLQILNRLEDLHNLGFIHGDLKLQNVVEGLDDNKTFYLIDYGLAEKYIDS